MTDASNGPQIPRPHYLPEMPVAGPPAIPPPVTPPPGGVPPIGGLQPEGADRWRWYHALLAFLGGFVAGQIAILIIGGAWASIEGVSFDSLSDNSSFILVASAVNEVFFIVFSYVVARMTGPVTARDFGLRRAPFWPTVWRMAAVMVGYFVLLAAYSSLVNLEPDTSPDKLGAATSDTHMLFFAILVGVMAPIAEEFFFRGFLFRALRNGLGLWAAAVVSGILFGALHIDSGSAERLLQVVPLAILGVSFALLYAWTGTLYATIALHATNNSIAVAAYAEKNNSDFGIALAGVIWLLMMLGCTFGYLLTDRRRRGDVEYALPQ